MTRVIPSERRKSAVIPSERSESRDLHLGFTRRRGKQPEHAELLSGSSSARLRTAPLYPRSKIFDGSGAEISPRHGAIRPGPEAPGNPGSRRCTAKRQRSTAHPGRCPRLRVKLKGRLLDGARHAAVIA
jgi:hypothetical protein